MPTTFEIISNNFKFHDKSIRILGYFSKSMGKTEALKDFEIGKKLDKFGGKISGIRQTLRLGGECALIRNLFRLVVKDRNKVDPKIFFWSIIEAILTIGFYTTDHLIWAMSVDLIDPSKRIRKLISDLCSD